MTSFRSRGFLWIAASAAAVVLAVAAQRVPRAQQEKTSKMKIGMSIEGDRFLAQELIPLKVTIENNTGSVVDFPDPEDLRNRQYSYTVSGPAFPEPRTYKPPISHPSPDEVSLLKMSNGERLEGQLALNLMFNFSRPGRYTLTGKFEWRGQSQTFGPMTFTIEGGSLISARVMADQGFQKSELQRVVALAGSPPSLYQFLFQEERPAIAEIRLFEMIRAGGAAAQAQQAIAPWTNFDRTEVFFARYGWHAPGIVAMESAEGSVRAAIPPDASVLHPALMTEDGTAMVFTVSGGRVAMLRFPPVQEGKPPAAAKEVWNVSPDSPVRAGCASLGPQPRNSPFVLLISQRQGAARFSLFEADGRAGERSVDVPGSRVLPNAEPALWIDGKGVAHAAALFAEDDSYRRVFVAEATWPVGGQAKAERQASVGLTREPRAAAAAYSVGAGRPGMLAWAIVLDDGSLVTSRSSTPVRTTRPVITPVQLLVMGGNRYVLVADPKDFVAFETLP